MTLVAAPAGRNTTWDTVLTFLAYALTYLLVVALDGYTFLAQEASLEEEICSLHSPSAQAGLWQTARADRGGSALIKTGLSTSCAR